MVAFVPCRVGYAAVLAAAVVAAPVLAQEWRAARHKSGGVSYGEIGSSGDSLLVRGKFTDTSRVYDVLEERDRFVRLSDGAESGWVFKAVLTSAEPESVPAAPRASAGDPEADNAARRDPYFGQRVFWKDDAVAKVGTTAVDIALIGWPARVGDVDGDWLWLGRAWVRKRDVRTLQENFDHYVEEVRRNPHSASAWIRRAGCWTERGELANAVKDYDEAIRLDPTNAKLSLTEGPQKSALGDYIGAIRDDDDAIRLDPRNATAFNNRGYGKKNLGDLADAIRDYDEAIRLDPKDIFPFGNRGWAKHNLGDYAGAIRDYDEVIRLDPTERISVMNFAFLRATCPDAALRDAAEAMRLGEQAIELDATSGYGWSAKACALAAAVDFAGAAKAQERALEDSSYAKDDAIDGGKHAAARLAKWAAGELWTSDMVHK